MPHAPPRRRAAASGTVLLVLLVALLSSTPAAEAWVCRPDPLHACKLVQDTTGLVFDVNSSPEGIGFMLLVGLEDRPHEITVTVCVHNLSVWISSTGYCSSPPQSSWPPTGLLP